MKLFTAGRQPSRFCPLHVPTSCFVPSYTADCSVPLITLPKSVLVCSLVPTKIIENVGVDRQVHGPRPHLPNLHQSIHG